MNHAEYATMYALEESYWWFRARRTFLFGMLRDHAPTSSGKRLLDLGCGTGIAMTELESAGYSVVGLDYSAEALRFSRSRNTGAELLQGDAARLPFADASFDVVVSLDVMEHVEDDVAMAAEIRRVLKPGGSAVINVPAHPFLWSDHDVALHHFRRYTRAGLRQLLLSTGFTIKRLTFAMCAVFPIALVFRLDRRSTRAGAKPSSHVVAVPTLLNALLVKVLAAEAILLRRLNVPTGLSLMAVVKRET